MTNNRGRVENYTNTCLVMGLINLMWIMIALWAWKGFFAALMLGAAIYYSINWLDMRLARTR
ncbi:hypothetical protein [Planktotalea sp.]|uniref:hypothetical protein n=1 Tax=Planktotalea sp. TaxID=2029877 RepID=UPI003D6A0373